MSSSGSIKLDRDKNRDAKATLTNAIKKVTNDNISIFIFPEGTRKKKNNDLIGKFKNGCFFIAQYDEVDIVPIYISGSIGIFAGAKLNKLHKDIKVIIDKPISFDNSNKRATISEIVRDKMLELAKKDIEIE